MPTFAEFSEGLTWTGVRDWSALVLNRAQHSSVVLASFAFGIFLPFIKDDLNLSAL